MSTSESKPALTSFLLIAVVLVLAGLIFVVQNLMPEKNPDTIVSEPATITPAADEDSREPAVAEIEPTDTPSDVATEATADLNTSAESSVASPANELAAQSSEPQLSESAQAESQIENPTILLESINEDESDVTVRASAPVEVPKSFPLRDAAKYFVPKEERSPGNLGGPPPFTEEMLSIMEQGNPSFAPPPAPGGSQ